jgi:hypothetical protein
VLYTTVPRFDWRVRAGDESSHDRTATIFPVRWRAGSPTRGAVRNVSNGKPRPRRRLSEAELAAAVGSSDMLCPLSPGEIAEWARRLGGGGAEDEERLQTLVTYWFHQSRSFSQVSQATDAARVRDYVKRRLAQGDPPDTIALPPHFHRIDKWLSELSNRLNAIRADLLDLPGVVTADLRIRFADYDKALDHLADLAELLNNVARAWHKPRPGQPSLEMESEAVGILICAVEDFKDTEFPSPRSYKRLAEIELVRLLGGRLFPRSTPSQINTMLRHYHKRRVDKVPAGRSPRKSKQL